MLAHYFKLLISFVVLLHFIGVTQLASSYSRDKSSFVSMSSMTEEENKKEKDTKEDDTEEKGLHQKRPLQIASLIHSEESFGLICASEHVEHQYNADQHTPPPDFTG